MNLPMGGALGHKAGRAPPGKPVTGPIFAAFLQCETKAYLLLHGTIGAASKTQELRRSLDLVL